MKVSVTAKNLSDYLGQPKVFREERERKDRLGVVTGLAWTPFGGEILFVEATRMEGRGGLMLTGQLGNVMRESAQAALSWVRTHTRDLGVEDPGFDRSDFHIHVPAGAMPKDGPSAGVAMVTALASLVTGRPIRSDTAMTGEISLRGAVLPIGGVKQKVLGARRAGIRRVILPAHNESDLEEVPEEIRKSMTFELVHTIDEVLERSLVPARKSRKAGGRKTGGKKTSGKTSSRRKRSKRSGSDRNGQRKAARGRGERG
jgi:ATP-dependent Lon protease